MAELSHLFFFSLDSSIILQYVCPIRYPRIPPKLPRYRLNKSANQSTAPDDFGENWYPMEAGAWRHSHKIRVIRCDQTFPKL